MVDHASRQVLATVLLAAALVAATIGHHALLEVCVCVVNALVRGMTAFGVTILFGVIRAFMPSSSEGGSIALRIVDGFSSLAFIMGLFFIIQYAYYLLEVVQ